MEIITVNEITKIGTRLQLAKMNLDQAGIILDGEELQEAKELIKTTDELLQLDVNFENIEKVQKFIEENDGRISHLGELVIMKGLEGEDGIAGD